MFMIVHKLVDNIKYMLIDKTVRYFNFLQQTKTFFLGE